MNKRILIVLVVIVGYGCEPPPFSLFVRHQSSMNAKYYNVQSLNERLSDISSVLVSTSYSGDLEYCHIRVTDDSLFAWDDESKIALPLDSISWLTVFNHGCIARAGYRAGIIGGFLGSFSLLGYLVSTREDKSLAGVGYSTLFGGLIGIFIGDTDKQKEEIRIVDGRKKEYN